MKQESVVFRKKKFKTTNYPKVSKVQLMPALLRDWLHKRQFKTTSVKLLPPPKLSSVTWVRDDLQPHLLDRCTQVPIRTSCWTLSRVPLVVAPAGFGTGKSRKMSGKGLFPKQRNSHSRCVSKVNYQQHVPFHIYFFRQSFENCSSLLSAALLLHIVAHFRQEYREHSNQKHQGTQDSEPSPRQPFLHFLCAENRVAQASQIQILLPLSK